MENAKFVYGAVSSKIAEAIPALAHHADLTAGMTLIAAILGTIAAVIQIGEFIARLFRGPGDDDHAAGA